MVFVVPAGHNIKERGEVVLVGPYVPVMFRTATQETRHGGRTPDIHRLLSEARERDEAEREDEDLLYWDG